MPATEQKAPVRPRGPEGGVKEQDALSYILEVTLPAEGARSISSRLGGLGAGYSGPHRWSEARRRFGRVLEAAESSYGKNGVKYCFVHFFLDAVRNGGVVAPDGGRRSSRLGRACAASQGAARLELLLFVQESFPDRLGIAEELTEQMGQREQEILALMAGGGSWGSAT